MDGMKKVDITKQQILYMMIEPAEAVPVWFSRVIEGIRKYCMKLRLSHQQIETANDLDTLPCTPVSVIVICSQNTWTQHNVNELKTRGIKPILIGVVPAQFGNGISGVMLERQALIKKVMEYFLSCGRKRMALVGVNHNASNDIVKTNVFLENAIAMGILCKDSCVYWIDKDIRSSVERFLAHSASYDSVICSNDYVAVCLMARANDLKIRIPQDLFVVGMGNTIIGRYTQPTLTSTTDDEFFEMGHQAVNAWRVLHENPDLSNITITVNAEIMVRGSTAFTKPSTQYYSMPSTNAPTISIGEESQSIRNLENCLQACDELDLKILHAILNGQSNSQIESELYLARSSLYYRQRKLYKLANVMNKNELKNKFSYYLPNFKEC